MSDVPPTPVPDSGRAGQFGDPGFRARRSGYGTSRSFFGLVLVALGVLFLLDNLRIIEARYFFRNFWPLLIVGWGAVRLGFGRGGERITGGAAVIFGALLLGNRLLGWHINVAGLFWPFVLIAIGLSMFSRPSRRWRSALPLTSDWPPSDSGAARTGDSAGASDPSGSLREVAVMGGAKRRSVSQSFRGGHVTAIMGSVEVDLLESRPAGDTVHIDVDALMGHVVLWVPRAWTVESHIASVLGNVEDRSERPIDAAATRLILDGTAFMGNVEIRN